MKYECREAYAMDGIPYIACAREPKPTGTDKQAMYHALCPYQRFCGEKRCAVLLPEWTRCKKNAAAKAQEAARAPLRRTRPQSRPKRRARRSAGNEP